MRNLAALLCAGLILAAAPPDSAQARLGRERASVPVTLRIKYRGKWYTHTQPARAQANTVTKIRGRSLIFNTMVYRVPKKRNRLSLQYQLELGPRARSVEVPLQMQAEVLMPEGREFMVAKGYGWRVLITLGKKKASEDDEEASPGYPRGNILMAARTTYLGKTYYVKQVVEDGTQSNFVGTVLAKKAPKREMILNYLPVVEKGAVDVQYQAQFSDSSRRSIFQVQGETALRSGIETVVRKGPKWTLKLEATPI